MKKKKPVSYSQLIKVINRFRTKERSILGSTLVFSTIHTTWALVLAGVLNCVGLIRVGVYSIVHLGLKLFLIYSVLFMFFQGIIKIYLRFFKKWDFKK